MKSQLVLMLNGKQGSGKTSTAKMIITELGTQGFDVIYRRFAQPLYAAHDAVLSVMREQYGLESPAIDGPLLQLLGTEWGRNTRSPNIWVDCLRHSVTNAQWSPTSDETTRVVVVDDLRFKNEFNAFAKNVYRVRLECPEDVRRLRAEKWRDNTQHPSEIDLDDWGDKFDLVLDTKILVQSMVVRTVVEKFLRWRENQVRAKN